MKTTKMIAMAVAMLVCVAVPASAAVVQIGGNPLLFDGIKDEPSRVDAYQGRSPVPDPVITAVFDLGVQSQPVTGALITYYSSTAGGVYKPSPVDFYFSNTANVFNAVPDVQFYPVSWPAEVYDWVRTVDAQATAAGSGQYLKIVANYNPAVPGSWVMLYEVQPVLGPPPFGDLIIKKYNDLNGDGNIAGDPLLPGWTFSVSGVSLTITDNVSALDMDPTAGIIKLVGLTPGDYTIADLLPAGWTATYDSDPLTPLGTVVAHVVGGQSATVQFGNANAVPEPAGLGLIGAALLMLKRRRS